MGTNPWAAVSGDDELYLPIGRSADRGLTVRPRRTVLAVARTLTSMTRLLDVLPVFRDDFRVQVLFTVAGRSAFGADVHDFVQRIEARVVPWRAVARTRFDLAVSTTDRGDLHRIKAPLLLMPHGAGYHKYVLAPDDDHLEVAGLARARLIRRRRVVPAAVVLSHEQQMAQLRRVCPEAMPFAVVAGDPCYDRIVSSRDRRDRYRRALGLGGRKLVVVTSTWGDESLFGRHPELLARLLAELPVDEYRVAAILHPNVPNKQVPWQVHAWLASAREAGLIEIPPHEGWRAALVAADWVIGDHGSVTFYGAALGTPLLLASDGADEVVPDTPLAALLRAAPRLDPRKGLRGQLESVARDHDPDRYTRIAADAFAVPGQSARILRDVMYDLMALSPPSRPPPVKPVPDPPTQTQAIEAFTVFTGIVGPGMGDSETGPPVTVVVLRLPATLDNGDGPVLPYTSRHIAVDLEGESDRRLREVASVLVWRGAGPPIVGEESDGGWAVDAFGRYPGSRVAAVVTGEDTCLMRLREGPWLRATVSRRRGERTLRLDPALAASAVYACRAAGYSLDDVRPGIGLRVGPAAAVVTLT